MASHTLENCCGLLRLLKEADTAEVNILSNPVFCNFRASLDAQMKQIKATGQHKVKKAEVITELFMGEGFAW